MSQPICIFIPTLTAGGAERVASILASHWCNEFDVVVITYFNAAHFFELDPRVSVLCLGLQPGRSAMARSVDVVVAARRFRRLVTRIQPKFVLSFMNKYNAFCLAALYRMDIPVVISERGSPTEELPRIRVFARNLLYPLAAGLICQTKDGLDFIAGQTRIICSEVIPNPTRQIIDLDDRRPEKIILAVGRLVPSKGFDHLLRAYAEMGRDDWRIVICGDGPMRRQLEAQAQELGIAHCVDFVGLVVDLSPFYRAAGIFAFTSMHEGFPNALAEALVSGLPTVSYDCPTGPADLIEDGVNGRLIDLGDEEKLAAALVELANCAEVRAKYGAEAAKLNALLQPKVIARQYLDFCRRASAVERSA